MTTILIPLSQGFEETEAITTIDLLRRANFHVITTSQTFDKIVVGAHGIKVEADALFTQIEQALIDAIVIPGGMGGTKINASHTPLLALIRNVESKGKLVAAICAGPLVLKAAGIITDSTKYSIYPGLESEMSIGTYCPGKVTVSENIITSRGPGTSIEFALAIISYFSPELAKTVASALK